jgi:hypothetical protein
VITLPALASRNAWAKDQGYTRSRAGVEALEFDRELGYRGTYFERSQEG